MNIRPISFFLFSLLPFFSFAQQFKGRVIDQETNLAIPLADVYFSELKIGTTTNNDGVFVLKDLLLTKIQIQISFIGYKTIHEEIDLKQTPEKVFYMEPSHIDLAEVVISVPGGKLQGENIVNIERKNIAEIDQGSVSLAEAISNIPGVDQNTTGTGIGKPVIRGLSGNRIVTYAQGIRMENQQWGDEHGLGVADQGVESVEVIKGPASLLYGSDALGGVLFFVDERYAGHNIMEGNAGTRFLSNSLGSYNDIGLKIHKDDVKINLFGGYTTNADYRIPGGDRVLNTRFDELSFKTAIGLNSKSWVSNTYYSFLENNFGITDTAVYTSSSERSVMLPFQKVNQHNLSFDNTYFFGESRLSLIVGLSENNRKEFEESKADAALDMKLRTLTYNLKWYSAQLGKHATIIAGSQGMHQANKNFGEEILVPDATTKDFSLFSIANYDLKKLQFQVGLRGDRRHISTLEQTTDEAIFPALNKSYESINYSAGGVFQAKNTSFRMNLSSGFRAPNTSELLSNGVHEGTQRYEIGNPNLKSENASQIDFTFDYQNDHFSFTVSPFLNYINNYIYLSPADSMIEDVPVYDYLQTKARLYGGEAGIHIHPHSVHWLHIESNLSTVVAEDRDGAPLPLIPATRINTTLKAEFSPRGKVQVRDVFLQQVAKLEQGRAAAFETPTPGYQVVNIGTNVDIVTSGKPIQLSAGVRNLFNTRYIDHLSRLKSMEIPNPGINFYVGIRIGFSSEIGPKM